MGERVKREAKKWLKNGGDVDYRGMTETGA